MRLKKAVKVAEKSPGPVSLEKLAFDASKANEEMPDMEEEATEMESLPPGTFIETRRNEACSHGVILGEVHTGLHKKYTAMMTSGEVWQPSRSDIVFTIPSLVSADLAARCGADRHSENDVQVSARVEVLRRIRELEQIVQSKSRIVRQKGLQAYDMLRSPDPTKWGTTTLAEVTALVDKSPKLLDLFAVHKYLMSDALHFIIDAGYQTSQAILVRPARDVAEIQTIMAFKRDKTGDLEAFAKKAHQVMAQGEKIRTEGKNSEPRAVHGSHQWNEKDKIILNFLIRSLRPVRSTQVNPYSLGQSAILKAITPDGPMVEDSEIHRILISLGVIAPWQDITALRPALVEQEEEEEKISKMTEKSCSLPPAPGPLGPEDLLQIDPLDAIRHDFGDMPVYVIDESTAEELDDGVSIEAIPNEPKNYWVHIHIADPASVIPRTHFLAERASRLGQTTYLNYRSYPLFPKSLMHDPKYAMSIGSRSKRGEPDRVLTFSAKIDMSGNVLEHKVRAGLIRNVQILDYDGVDFGVKGSNIPTSYPFGHRPLPVEHSALTESQVSNLRLLCRAADGFQRKRMDAGLFAAGNCSASVGKLTIPKGIVSPTVKPMHFQGFPQMTYSVRTQWEDDWGSRAMVAEMAKLASRVASRFALEKGLPMLRRFGITMSAPEEHMQTILDLRHPNSHVNMLDVIALITDAGSGGYSLDPRAHPLVGAAEGEGYCRATSPLRRYSDMVCHWQLHHGLLGPRALTAKPPFDELFMEDYLVALPLHEKKWKSVERDHIKFWNLYYLKRWMDGAIPRDSGVGNPLVDLDAFVTSDKRLNPHTKHHIADTMIPSLGLKGIIELPEQLIQLGNRVKARVKEVKLGSEPQLLLAMDS
ncbi:hypothetical protein BDQ12DRAFT_615567 [Crucibulum laeve]|uniref:RNB domain-containing protein n=1 Tax=Crucibulum laeve TaxID=68775 RepID=A0A5C3LKX4_9AGAR|nr:hypothetical protein BDQ12DRAFT_615567 [Crucibulum laeve]